MSDSEHRRIVPFYWLVILVLAVLLAGAVFLLLRPAPPAAEPGQPEVPTSDGETSASPSPTPTDTGSSEAEPTPETGPLRAKLSSAVAGFSVNSWVESAGLIKFGAVEAYEGFYVQEKELTSAANEESEFEPTLIAAGRWETTEAATEWLTEFAEEQAVLPPDLKAEGQVPGVGGEPVGTYRYFESSDASEAGVVWTNNDLGLLLVGEPEVVELLFTKLPL